MVGFRKKIIIPQAERLLGKTIRSFIVADFSLNAELRTVKGKKVNQLRREGFIPGTVYGPAIDPLKIQFPERELNTTLKSAGGTNVIDLNVDGKIIPVLAREVQRTILQNDILHVDFLAPDMTKKIRADVPVVFVGQNALIIARKGIMLTGPNTLSLEMLPSNMMNQIIVDISVMTELGDAIAVKDLDLEGITIINDPEEMIAKIVQPSAQRAAEMEAMLTGEEGELGEEDEDEE
jgi:large subunit ribosomal protein L25